MPYGVYTENGIYIRGHSGAEPAGDFEPAGVVRAIGGRDRAPASHATANRLQAPASAAGRGFRRGHRGRTAPSLSIEAGTAARDRHLAGAIPPVLVGSRGRS